LAFANSRALPGRSRVTEQGTFAFLSFFAREIAALSWEIEIRRALIGSGVLICARSVILSRPKEIPVAGISLERYLPMILS